MASPQLENGHTRICNELLEKLAAQRLSPNEWRALLGVIRLTYGYHRKRALITGTKLAEVTRMYRQHASEALKKLAARNLIVRNGKEIGPQKDWERWLSQPPVTSKICNSPLLHDVTAPCVKLSTYKDNYKDKKDSLSQTPVTKPGNGRFNGDVKRLFAALNEERGWPSPKPSAESKAIRWMLGHEYTTDHIIGCYRDLKKQDFWRDKALFMMSVQSQIGQWKKPKSQKEYTGR